jgi:hypothetical protein
MDVLVRDVPEQLVITEQRMVDQAALESWLPGAMSRVLKAAGDGAAGTVDQPCLERDHLPHEPVFIVIYEGTRTRARPPSSAAPRCGQESRRLLTLPAAQTLRRAACH